MFVRRLFQIRTLTASTLACTLAIAAMPGAIAAPSTHRPTNVTKQAVASVRFPTFASLFSIQTLTGLPQMAGVNLSSDQSAQIGVLLSEAHGQLEEIVSVEQQETLLNALNQNLSLESARAEMALTEAQESQIQFVVQYVMFQVGPILTAEQQRIISENFQASTSR